jgi:hypothetical protein
VSGTVFELLAPGYSTEDNLWTFNGVDGTNPICSVVLDSSGNLYGMTYTGGLNRAMVVFKATP